MTARNARRFAFAITVGVAILAGLFTGWIAGASADCDNSSDRQITKTDEGKPNNTSEKPTVTPKSTESNPLTEEEGRPSTRSSPQRTGGPGGGGTALATVQFAKDGDNCGDFSVPASAVGFAGTLLAGLIVLALWRPGSEVSAPAVVAPAGGAGFVDTGVQLAGQRRSLIDALIFVRDRATSPAIADRVRDELLKVGVYEIAPVGAVFDPSKYEAGSSVATPDPAQHGVISAVEVVGYRDGNTVLRPAVVTVLQHNGGSGQ